MTFQREMAFVCQETRWYLTDQGQNQFNGQDLSQDLNARSLPRQG